MIHGSKILITCIAMFSAFMALLDVTIVNVALNDIRASFGTPLDQIGWVSTGYMMANIVMIPLTGWMQRCFGFRIYLACSVFVFTLGSACCAFAWDLPSLVFFRIIQGLGGGAIIPTAQSILMMRYARSEQGTAAALFGLGAVTGPLLGPSIGGYLIEWFNWHFIFWVNIPFGVLIVLFTWSAIKEPSFKALKAPIDVLGLVLLVFCMSTFQFMIEEGNREGWFESTSIILCAIIASVSFVGLLIRELTTLHPIIDLRVFKNRNYSLSTGINFLVGFAMFSGSFMFALYCGVVLNYRAVDTGRIFLYAGFLQLFLMPLVGRLAPRIDKRTLLFLGISLVTLSLWCGGYLNADSSFFDLLWVQILRAAGLSFIFIPVSMLALSDLKAEQLGNATGLFSLTRELGGSIGTAMMGQLMNEKTAFYKNHLNGFLSLDNPVLHWHLNATQSALKSAPRFIPAEPIIFARLKFQAMILSFEQGFFTAAVVFLSALLFLFFVKKPLRQVSSDGLH